MPTPFEHLLAKTLTRLGLNQVNKTGCYTLQPAGDLYRALAGSNEQALASHHATCTQSLKSFIVCKEYKPLRLP